MHYANIHGSPVEGSFLGPFSTADLTRLHNCVIGTFSYVQAGELADHISNPGQIWVHSNGKFSFTYNFNRDILDEYIHLKPGGQPSGIFIDFVESRQADFETVFELVQGADRNPVPSGASLSRFAVVRGDNTICENVLVAQRAYLENTHLGKGSNAQENCYIINSHLEGMNVTAHGGKVIHARLGEKVFVGFNSFLRGRPDCELSIGPGCIVMPHTIIDLEEPLEIPAYRLIWGCIKNRRGLDQHSLPFEALAKVKEKVQLGAMHFEGNGLEFVDAFNERIEHILEANGAFFDGNNNRGHAQKAQVISFNTIQPYPEGVMKGLYPTIDICP
jgi:carbonic anhydrase/acetyltransferase-like protein (isoleucine patch superfamily)